MDSKQIQTVSELLEQDGEHYLHLNARSIKNKKTIDELKLRFTGTAFKFISISESWLTDDDCTSTYDIGGYHMYRSDRAWKDNPVNILPKVGGDYVHTSMIICTATVMNLVTLIYRVKILKFNV